MANAVPEIWLLILFISILLVYAALVTEVQFQFVYESPEFQRSSLLQKPD